MPFTPKDWKNYPDTSTPINEAALEDMERRLSAYTDATVAAVSGGSVGSNIYNAVSGWPARPGIPGIVIWVGGGPLNDPTPIMVQGDLWFPSTETIA